jgi:hypothetical protein
LARWLGSERVEPILHGPVAEAACRLRARSDACGSVRGLLPLLCRADLATVTDHKPMFSGAGKFLVRRRCRRSVDLRSDELFGTALIVFLSSGVGAL